MLSIKSIFVTFATITVYFAFALNYLASVAVV